MASLQISAKCSTSMPAMNPSWWWATIPVSANFSAVLSANGCEASIDLKKGAVAVRNEPQRGVADMVPYSQDSAHALRGRRLELPAENFQK